jgi:hypothetical protein
MAFTPLGLGTSTALSGTVVSPRFLEIGRTDTEDFSRFEDLTGRKVHGSPRDNPKSIEYTIFIIIISAFIFITVIAIFDVIRNIINNYYAHRALTDPNSNNTQEDIERAEIANQNGLWSSIVFATVTFLIAIIGTWVIDNYFL